MSKDTLIPLIQDKHSLVKEYYGSSGSEETNDLLVQARREVEAAVKDAKVRWLAVKVEAIEGYRFDLKIAWAVMRDISSMFGGIIKSKPIINMVKPYETMAKNYAENGKVF